MIQRESIIPIMPEFYAAESALSIRRDCGCSGLVYGCNTLLKIKEVL
jgi:hypothetical protein